MDLGGYTDWRMPTVKEGNSIQHYGTTYPSIWRKYFDIAMQLKHLEDTTFSTGGFLFLIN